jgi:hypothetical protein
MTMTIHQRPDEVTPAFNPVVYVIGSSNSGISGHKFILDIKVGSTLITRERFTPAPLQVNAFIDIGRVVSNLVKYDLDFSLDQCYPMLNSKKDFTIEIGESYGGVDYLGLVSDTFTAVNIGLSPYDFLDYDFANYEQKILNKQTTKLRIDSKAWLYFYHTNTNQITGIRVTATNAAGTTTISVIDNPYNASNPADRFIYCPIGANMNDIPADQLTSGTTGNVLPADTVSVLIELLDTATVTDSMTYEIIGTCYKDYEIYYLNSNGGFDTLVFNKNYSIKRNLQFQNTERINSSMLTATSYGYNSWNGQAMKNQVETRQRWMLNTDWINEVESAALFEMVSSPIIFLNDNGVIKRVNQNLSDYQEENQRAKKIFNFKVELTDSLQFERQWIN